MDDEYPVMVQVMDDEYPIMIQVMDGEYPIMVHILNGPCMIFYSHTTGISHVNTISNTEHRNVIILNKIMHLNAISG